MAHMRIFPALAVILSLTLGAITPAHALSAEDADALAAAALDESRPPVDRMHDAIALLLESKAGGATVRNPDLVRFFNLAEAIVFDEELDNATRTHGVHLWVSIYRALRDEPDASAAHARTHLQSMLAYLRSLSIPAPLEVFERLLPRLDRLRVGHHGDDDAALLLNLLAAQQDQEAIALLGRMEHVLYTQHTRANLSGPQGYATLMAHELLLQGARNPGLVDRFINVMAATVQQLANQPIFERVKTLYVMVVQMMWKSQILIKLQGTAPTGAETLAQRTRAVMTSILPLVQSNARPYAQLQASLFLLDSYSQLALLPQGTPGHDLTMDHSGPFTAYLRDQAAGVRESALFSPADDDNGWSRGDRFRAATHLIETGYLMPQSPIASAYVRMLISMTPEELPHLLYATRVLRHLELRELQGTTTNQERSLLNELLVHATDENSPVAATIREALHGSSYLCPLMLLPTWEATTAATAAITAAAAEPTTTSASTTSTTATKSAAATSTTEPTGAGSRGLGQ